MEEERQGEGRLHIEPSRLLILASKLHICYPAERAIDPTQQQLYPAMDSFNIKQMFINF